MSDGGSDSVEVHFAGGDAGAMGCGLSSGEMVCRWEGPEPLDAGSYPYVLEVAAPGYAPVEVPATVTVAPPNPSACCPGPYATLSPASVSLERK